MDVKLIVTGGKASKHKITLNLPTLIGRSGEADLKVAHPMVSRRHCELSEFNGLVVVRDLGSLNGTLIDDQKVSEATLHPDDEFSVGPLTFRVVYKYAGDQSAEAADAEPAEGLRPLVQDSAKGAFSAEPKPARKSDETLPIDEPVIAPADGQLPPSGAWADIQEKQSVEETLRQPDEQQPAAAASQSGEDIELTVPPPPPPPPPVDGHGDDGPD